MAGKNLKKAASGKGVAIKQETPTATMRQSTAERGNNTAIRNKRKAVSDGPTGGKSSEEDTVARRRSTRACPVVENNDVHVKEELTVVPSAIEGTIAMNGNRGDESSAMSAFELERLENIRRNQEVLRSLGLGATRSEMGLNAAAQRIQQVRKKTVGSNPGLKPVKREPRAPTRRSARMEGKDAPFYSEEKLIMEVEAQSAREEEKRMDEGPLTLETLNRSEEGGADFLGLLKQLLSEQEAGSLTSKGKGLAPGASASSSSSSKKKKPDMDYVERLAALTLAEEDILKLTPSRVTSMVVHPSERTLVVVASDVDGHLGVWRVDGDKDVFQFRPHIAKISSMQYSPGDPSKLISSSHDGTVRCLDLEKEAFDLLVATDEKFQDSGFTCASQAAHSPDKLYLAGHEGSTGLLDVRSRTLAWVHGEAHGKKVNSIEAHPTREHLFVSSSTDRAVTLWDDRKPKKEVWTIAHTNSINNATFNPTGAHLLITCQNHMLYLHADPIAAKFTASNPPDVTTAHYRIKHNNNTGRWLSKFWPTWDPKHPDAFVIGSLEQPRRIEVFSASSGFQIASVRSEWMNSVQSINQFHPTRNILVGANSSGRVHSYRGPGEERR